MAKKSKRNRRQGSQQSLGSSGYIFDGVMAMARTLVNTKKDWGVEKMYEFADATQKYASALEDIPNVGGYATAAADSLKDLADYVNETEFDQILKDASNFAKRHPVPMIIGGAIAGLALTQILRSNEKVVRTVRGRAGGRARTSSRVNGHSHLNA